MGDQGSGLAEPKAQITKHPLTLANAHLLSVVPLDERRQDLAVPEVCPQSYISWGTTQNPADLLQLSVREPPWAT